MASRRLPARGMLRSDKLGEHIYVEVEKRQIDFTGTVVQLSAVVTSTSALSSPKPKRTSNFKPALKKYFNFHVIDESIFVIIID